MCIYELILVGMPYCTMLAETASITSRIGRIASNAAEGLPVRRPQFLTNVIVGTRCNLMHATAVDFSTPMSINLSSSIIGIDVVVILFDVGLAQAPFTPVVGS
jgi:hypothetical protein